MKYRHFTTGFNQQVRHIRPEYDPSHILPQTISQQAEQLSDEKSNNKPNFMTKFKDNHSIHGVLVGAGIYTVANMMGMDNAIPLGLITGVGSYFYMSNYKHQLPWEVFGR